jgi:hypothetical protein
LAELRRQLQNTCVKLPMHHFFYCCCHCCWFCPFYQSHSFSSLLRDDDACHHHHCLHFFFTIVANAISVILLNTNGKANIILMCFFCTWQNWSRRHCSET